MQLKPDEILKMAGEALYGPRWQTGLAIDLRVSDRIMLRWLAGSDVPRAEVLAELERLVKERIEKLAEIGTALVGTRRQLLRAETLRAS